jgi:histidine triad (HIT) family protein
MSDKTLFTKIIDREILAEIVYEDELCIAIRDIEPQAPVHLLVIPKKPIPRLGAAKPEDEGLLGHLLTSAAAAAGQNGIGDGFRIIINHGKAAGESVPHLHIHVLGGRNLSWPPG